MPLHWHRHRCRPSSDCSPPAAGQGRGGEGSCRAEDGLCLERFMGTRTATHACIRRTVPTLPCAFNPQEEKQILQCHRISTNTTLPRSSLTCASNSLSRSLAFPSGRGGGAAVRERFKGSGAWLAAGSDCARDQAVTGMRARWGYRGRLSSPCNERRTHEPHLRYSQVKECCGAIRSDG
jgi:hypothetical protein